MFLFNRISVCSQKVGNPTKVGKMASLVYIRCRGVVPAGLEPGPLSVRGEHAHHSSRLCRTSRKFKNYRSLGYRQNSPGLAIMDGESENVVEDEVIAVAGFQVEGL